MTDIRKQCDRNLGWDALRVLCIYAVVAIHVPFADGDIRMRVLDFFPDANAVFAFLAGWFMYSYRYEKSRLSNIRDWVMRRSFRLLLPYAVWTTFFIFFHMLAAGVAHKSALPSTREVVSYVFAGTASVQFWFVITLFYAQSILAMLSLLRMPRLKGWDLFAYDSFAFIIGYLLIGQFEGELHHLMFMLVFCSMGSIVRHTLRQMPALNSLYEKDFIQVICVIFSLIIILAQWMHIGALKLSWWNSFLPWCLLFDSMLRLGLRNDALATVKRIIAYLSPTIMGVYLVHWLVIRLTFKPILSHVGTWGGRPIYLLGGAFFALVISVVIVKTTSWAWWLWGTTRGKGRC